MKGKSDDSLISFCFDEAVFTLVLVQVSGVDSVAASFCFRSVLAMVEGGCVEKMWLAREKRGKKETRERCT